MDFNCLQKQTDVRWSANINYHGLWPTSQLRRSV